MLVFEFKLKASPSQKQLINDAIRTAQFIRNSCLRYWMDSKKEDRVNRFALNKYTKVLADNPDFPWTKQLNSMARQAAAERTWFAISRFFDNCQKGIKGKKGYPSFKKNSRSVEYKTTGWSLSDDRKHLKVSRQRKDFAVKTARTLCSSNDVIVLENLNVRGLVKNHNLALSISDASWSIFREWLEYFGTIFNREIITVDPKFTSQDCSNCGQRIKKSLSTRTHQCSCGAVLCRDHNAAINILNRGTGGQSETAPCYGVDASGQMTLWLMDENLKTKVAG